MNLKENRKPVNIILREVSEVAGVSEDLILSHTRKKEATDAKMLFCYMAREEGYLQREIGSFIGLVHSRVSIAYYDVRLRKETFRPLINRLSASAKTLSDTGKVMNANNFD